MNFFESYLQYLRELRNAHFFSKLCGNVKICKELQKMYNLMETIIIMIAFS